MKRTSTKPAVVTTKVVTFRLPDSRDHAPQHLGRNGWIFSTGVQLEGGRIPSLLRLQALSTRGVSAGSVFEIPADPTTLREIAAAFEAAATELETRPEPEYLVP